MSNSSGSADSPSQEDTPLSDWLTFMSVVMAAGVYAAAWTIPNAVLPQMQGDLSVSIDQISWVVTATVVAGAIGIPLTPWLSHRLGSKKLMMTTLGAFTLASVLVGTASTFEEVIIWRVVAALSGAPIIALSQAVTMEIFDGDRRTMAFSMWSIGMAAGWVFAPAAGAWLADLVSWRLTFLSIVPFGIVALMCCGMFMPAMPKKDPVKFDWTGFLALAFALTMMQVVVNRGQRMDWFDSPVILVLSGLGLIAFYLYLVHTSHCRQPFLDWVIFRDRNLVFGLLITMIYAYVGLVPLVILPTMLEQLRGLEVFTVGLLVVPRGTAQMLGMVVAGIMASRIDPRKLLVCGLIVFSASSWYMAHYNLSIGVWDVFWPTVVQGFSMAFIWIPAMALMYATIDNELRTSAATLVSLTYSLSSSLGVALAVTVLGRSVQINHAEIGALVEPTREIFQFGENSTNWDTQALDRLIAMEQEVTLQAYAIGYANVFWLLAVSTLVILPLVLFLRRPA